MSYRLLFVRQKLRKASETSLTSRYVLSLPVIAGTIMSLLLPWCSYLGQPCASSYLTLHHTALQVYYGPRTVDLIAKSAERLFVPALVSGVSQALLVNTAPRGCCTGLCTHHSALCSHTHTRAHTMLKLAGAQAQLTSQSRAWGPSCEAERTVNGGWGVRRLAQKAGRSRLCQHTRFWLFAPRRWMARHAAVSPLQRPVFCDRS